MQRDGCSSLRLTLLILIAAVVSFGFIAAYTLSANAAPSALRPPVLEFRVTTTGETYNLDVDGNIVVWDTQISAEVSDIHGYNLATSQHFIVSERSSDEWIPRVSGPWVVWISREDSPPCPVGTGLAGDHIRDNVLAKNLLTEDERTLVSSCKAVYPPDISGDYVVWSDGDVWLYHIPSHSVTQVTSDTAYEGQPAVGPPWVAWPVFSDTLGSYVIMGYNIDTSEIDTLSIDAGWFLDVADGILVWQRTLGGNDDRSRAIVAMDLASTEVLTIAHILDPDDVGYGPERPRTDGSTVVWWHNAGNLPADDVYAYDISGRKIFSVTSPSTHDQVPSVSDNVVVWRRGVPEGVDVFGARILTKLRIFPVCMRGASEH